MKKPWKYLSDHAYDLQDENGSDFEEDYKIEDHDCILLAAKSDEEQRHLHSQTPSHVSSSLEVHVYDSESGNFFLHHDIILPAFPLSMAWLECAPEQSEDNSLSIHFSSLLNLPQFPALTWLLVPSGLVLKFGTVM